MHRDDFKSVLLSKPHCTLGKNGITSEFIDHVLKLLKRYKIIKIKILKSAVLKATPLMIANEVAEKTNSHVLDVRGKKIVLSLQPISIK